ncbi:DUF732 domain-containing protein [Mycolicibacterium rutilum]|uniref:DUF732 domain-containing protein n=1 Tax=Mycolicibacterium rutilum TaxID=370526 RepID=UPI0012FF7001|nr:DUF732 domain-containing protein [Mycolicibacterium rutilum]
MNLLRYLFSTLVVAGAALALAAPAVADEADFVRKMHDQLVFLTPDEILAAGYRVCAAARSGVPASDSVVTVSDELGISVPSAGDLVSLAVVELGC